MVIFAIHYPLVVTAIKGALCRFKFFYAETN